MLPLTPCEERSGVSALPIEHAHALWVGGLPEHHGDPFDRLVTAQAQPLDVPIVTADGQFDAYEVETVRATWSTITGGAERRS